MKTLRLMAILLILLGASAQQIFAQIITITPIPSQSTPTADDIWKEVFGNYYAQFETRTLADYNVVYLGDFPSSYEGELFSGEGVKTHAPEVTIITSNDEFTALAAEAEINALVIHPSALAWLDTDVTQSLYRTGTAIATVGMRYEDRLALTGDYCPLHSHSGDPAANDRTTQRAFNSTTILISAWIIKDDLLTSEQIQRVYERELKLCKDANLNAGVVWGIASTYNIVTFTDENIADFATLLTGYAGYKEMTLGEYALHDVYQRRVQEEVLR